MRPQASAVLPLMFVYVPGASVAAATSWGWSNSSAVSPKFRPARSAARFASRTFGLPWYFASIQSTSGCAGRVYIQQISPRAKKFLERSASRRLTSRSSVACRVIEVIGTS